MNAIHLDELLAARLIAKRDEDIAVARRRAIDDQITEAIGKVDEGTLNQVVANHRIVVTYSLNRSISKDNWPEVKRLWPIMPPHVRECFREVPYEVNVRQYKDLQAMDPVSFGTIAKLVDAKPSRPSIKIEDLTPTA